MFSWQGTEQDVDRLIARAKYPRAIKIMRDFLRENPNDSHLRKKLAEVLVLAGERREAARMLEDMVGELADDGFLTKAIAVVKRIQRIDPERGDLDQTLAGLVHQREVEKPYQTILIPKAPAPLPGEQPLTAPPPASTAAPMPSASAAPAPVQAPSSTEAAAAAPPAAVATEASPPFDGDDTGTDLDESRPGYADALLESELFRDFSVAELQAFIGGLNLITFQPGEIVISEGEPGSSLLVLASGQVRVYVRNDLGHHVQLRQLDPGEFFGEISILTGMARTATVTAAKPCEILELDQKTLDEIGREHPRVSSVIRQVCEQRAKSPEEMKARQEIEIPL